MAHMILLAAVLVALTAFAHALGFGLMLYHWKRRYPTFPTRLWPMFRMLVGTILFLVLLHAVEISIWGFAYLWAGCLPDAESAFYFSGVAYSTIGFGDIVLEKPWRLLAPLEGVTGVIMSGLSAALFFVLIQKIYLTRSGGLTRDSRNFDRRPAGEYQNQT